MGILVTSLLPRWQESWSRERARRLLPAAWLADEREEAKAASEAWASAIAARNAASPMLAVPDDDR